MKTALEWAEIIVDGEWNNLQNRQEAIKVIEEIVKLIQDEAKGVNHGPS